LTADEIAHDLEAPIRLVRDILFDLTESGVLAEVKIEENQVLAYHPSQDIDKFTIKNVFNMLDQRGIDDIPIAESKELEKISQSLTEIDKIVQESGSNISLRKI